MSDSRVPVVIPAFEPDERFINLSKAIKSSPIDAVIIVDDGSGKQYEHCFSTVADILKEKCVVITHEVNKGKGAALKTAFEYVLNHMPDVIGVVTADSDGQHDIESIQQVQNGLLENKDKLVLGVRRFEGQDIPWKSQFGNKLTRTVFRYITGVDISDTQTGLRGIPRSLMPDLITIKYDRFEFEMKVLLDCAEKSEIIEVPITTIYDSKENHQTHFNPVVDSIRIYRVLGSRFLRFIVSSLSSSVLDLVLFALFSRLFQSSSFHILYSTILARIISSAYNYVFNYKVVFSSKSKVKSSMAKYTLLAIVQMLVSGLLVTVGAGIFAGINEVFIKMVVDTFLFFLSYKIQQTYVYGD